MTDRIASLEALLERDPDDAECLYSLGFEHAKAGDTERAVACYDRAIAVDPDFCYAYFHKARALEEADRNDEACAALRAGIERATTLGDAKARDELAGYLDTIE
jgi:tetratricopeptide (TPR) repeat protein